MKPTRTRPDAPIRCSWAVSDLMVRYHDEEWGVPLHDDQRLFEFLILEGAQAGLSWEIILRKRESFRAAFNGFDPAKVARYREAKVTELLSNPGIVRNRLKVAAAIANAQAFRKVQGDFGSFDAYLWGFAGGPKLNAWRSSQPAPTRTAESDSLSKDLSRRGFKFVGSTICYAFMQAVGLVNDHSLDCFRRAEIAGG